MAKLDGKVAVVTGASKGIGAEIARHLAAEGAAVVVNYASDREGALRVVKAVEAAGGRAVAVQADLSEPDQAARPFEEAVKAYGRVDVLVNNAGIYRFAALEEVTPELFHAQFDLNVLGLLLATREAVARFGPEGGSVVNIGSVAGTSAPPSASIYSATKAAVDAITRSLSKELGPRKIRVNSVNPGMVETEGVHTAGFLESDLRRHAEAGTPLGRIGQPGDIAPAVAFLASDEARWVTGEALNVAGGYR